MNNEYLTEAVSAAETAEKAAEDNPLANGLPEWTIEPPVIAVRRKPKAS